MPNEHLHGRQIQENLVFLNERIYDYKDRARFPDRIIISAFELSLHCVEWYFAREHSWHSPDHYKRGQNLASKDCKIRHLYRDYRRLYDLNKSARYECAFSRLKFSDIKKSIDVTEKIQSDINQLYADFPFAPIEPLLVSVSTPSPGSYP